MTFEQWADKWAFGMLTDKDDAGRAMRLASRAAWDAGRDANPLRAFAKEVMQAWPEGDIDGGCLQAIAIKHGLLRARVVPCEECDCDGDGPCYERTELIK